jgi:hypothetical protein
MTASVKEGSRKRLDMGMKGSARRSRTLLVAALCAVACVAASVGDASAQWWPWAKEEPPPRPKKAPPQGELPPLEPGPPTNSPPFGPRTSGGALCLQLEQRLVAETQGKSREELPKIEADMRDLERTLRSASTKLERSDCFETFFFAKSLRPGARCRQLNDAVETTRERLAELDRQRKQIMGSGDRTMQNEIIRELARNGCGEQYVREAKKRDVDSNPFAMLFGGGEETEGPKGPRDKFGSLPFATYRTLCVRLCDGYYFPISFSTLQNHFQRDADLCQKQCAAPSELFYHENPGGAVEQMKSFGTQEAYISLKSAFRYRKEYVPGCSCKQAEYNPAAETEKLEKKAESPAPQGGPPGAGVKLGAKR